MERATSISSGRSFITRTFSRTDTGSAPSKDIKGPLGLSTLFDPGHTAIADLVFVHGLGGGSKSTWTKSGDPALYWPQQWLPQEPDFQDVRIHSFGYNSNWGNESILNVHDFSKSLLGSLHDCPAIPRSTMVSLLIRSDVGLLFLENSLTTLATIGSDCLRWPQHGWACN